MEETPSKKAKLDSASEGEDIAETNTSPSLVVEVKDLEAKDNEEHAGTEQHTEEFIPKGLEKDEEVNVEIPPEEEQDEDTVLENAKKDLRLAIDALEDHFEYFMQYAVDSIEIKHLDKAGQENIITFPLRTHEVLPAIEGSSDIQIKMKEDFRRLLDAAELSPFGQGKATKYDASVRKAKHIPAERIVQVKIINEKFKMDEFLIKVRESLYPLETGIDAKLLKLNIYEEGDFFVEHQDTPLSEDNIGSLVISLPVAHTGGELILKHRSDQVTRDFGAALAPTAQRHNFSPYNNIRQTLESGYYDIHSSMISGRVGDILQREQQRKCMILCGQPAPLIGCCAFYGDVKHSIAKVMSGFRLTLSYQLVRTGEKPAVVEEDQPAVPSATAGQTKQPLPNFSALSVPQLKDLCRSKGLKVGGKKDELISRLLQNVYDEQHKGAFVSSVKYPDVASPSAAIVSVTANNLRRSLLNYFNNKKFLPNGGNLAFPCQHLYERPEDVPKEDQMQKPDLKASEIRLRGVDAILMVIGARAKIPLEMISVVTIEDEHDTLTFTLDKIPFLQNVSNMIGELAVIESDFFSIAVDRSNYEDNLEDYDWVFEEEEAPVAKMMNAFVSDTGYFGNESSQGCVYAKCAIVFKIPAVDLPQREACIAALERDIVAAAFQGIQGGVSKEMEEYVSKQRYEDYWKHHSPVSLEQVRKLAVQFGVPTHGNIKQVLSRVHKAMQRGRRWAYDEDEGF